VRQSYDPNTRELQQLNHVPVLDGESFAVLFLDERRDNTHYRRIHKGEYVCLSVNKHTPNRWQWDVFEQDKLEDICAAMDFVTPEVTQDAEPYWLEKIVSPVQEAIHVSHAEPQESVIDACWRIQQFLVKLSPQSGCIFSAGKSECSPFTGYIWIKKYDEWLQKSDEVKVVVYGSYIVYFPHKDGDRNPDGDFKVYPKDDFFDKFKIVNTETT
jgi:hypothetical protein